MRAEITQVKDGRIFVGVIAPPINDADIVIEFHRDETATRPADVRFMILSREEFQQLHSDWSAFANTVIGRAKRVADKPSPLPTLEEVREGIEMAWTDATHLPETPGSHEVCEHLQSAAECLDRMIEHARASGK